jgi:hypothetical protein
VYRLENTPALPLGGMENSGWCYLGGKDINLGKGKKRNMRRKRRKVQR